MEFKVPEDDQTRSKRDLVVLGKPFTTENQPSNEAKRRGWKKKLIGQELAAALLELPYVGPRDEGLRQTLANYFGIQDDDEITNELMIYGSSIAAALQRRDWDSARWIIEQARGKPKEVIQFEDQSQVKQIIIQPLTAVDAPEIKTSTNDSTNSITPSDPRSDGLANGNIQ